jgi:hypothetical protein
LLHWESLESEALMKSFSNLLFAAVAVAAVPACVSDAGDDGGGGGGGDGGGGGGGFGTGGGGGGGECQLDCDFAFRDMPAVGVGTVADVRHDGPRDLALRVESSDPSVVSVAVEGGEIRVTGRGAGAAKLTARAAATGAVLDEVEVQAVDVASIELHFRPGPGLDQPVAQLAGLAGSRDAFGIVYRAADGRALTGRGELEVTGASLALAGTPDAYRLSDLVVRRAQVELAFGAPGTGTLVAKLIGAPLRRVFPIEVVAAPASLQVVPMVIRGVELVAATDPVQVKEAVGADIVGRTADGRFVGGVTATWSSPDAIAFVASSAAPSESVFQLDAPGAYDLVAKVGAATITTRIHAQ